MPYQLKKKKRVEFLVKVLPAYAVLNLPVLGFAWVMVDGEVEGTAKR